MKKKYFILPLLFICFYFIKSSSVFAQAIILESTTEQINIASKISIFKDSCKCKTIKEVSSEVKFESLEQEILNFGLSEDIYWLKVELKNNSDNDFLIELGQPLVKNVEFYYQDSTQDWQKNISGYDVLLKNKVEKHHLHLFNLPTTKESKTYYLRINYKTKPIPVTVWEKETFLERAYKQKIIYGVYVGIMIFVILNNILLFFSLRSVTYLHYTLLVLLYAIFSSVNDGYMLYLWEDANIFWIYKLNPIVNQPNGLLYCLLFLEVRKFAPKLYKYSFIVFIYFVSYIGWSFFLPELVVLTLSQVHALIGLFLMTFIGIRLGRKGNKLGYLFAISYFIFFIIATVEVIYVQTGSPAYFFELSHVSIAILIEVFLLSYILSKRFEWEKKVLEERRVFAQEQMIEQVKENERIVKEQNIVLEKKVNERTAQLQEKNEEIHQQNEELSVTNDKLEEQHFLLEGAYNDIKSSINYAKRIQDTLFPSKESLKKVLNEYVLYFRPRDIVSGDFYWTYQSTNKDYLVVADCTGHGVPGAFMSLLGANLLDRIIFAQDNPSPNIILNELRTAINKQLKQTQTSNRDGMDIAILSIDKNTKQIEFSSAKRPLMYFQNDEFFEIKGDSLSIGGHIEREKDKVFSLHTIDSKEKVELYLFSDGYTDQFGGTKNTSKKFMTKNFRKMLQEIHKLPMSAQWEIINDRFLEWKGEEEQIDDVLVLGFRALQ